MSTCVSIPNSGIMFARRLDNSTICYRRMPRKVFGGRVTLNQTSTRRGTVKCEVILTVPHKTLSVKQTAFDVLEAVDKAADKMARCCRKYKTSQSKTSRRGLIRWLRHRVWPGN